MSEASEESKHLDNIYRLLNEHTALINQNQQSVVDISTQLVDVLKSINENLKEIKNYNKPL